jgi:hypothetical protein
MIGAELLRTRVRERLGEQRVLVRSLLELREQLQGSLFARYGECGKEGCACRQGRKHGPYYVLSLRSAGKGAFTYLDPEQAREAKALVTRSREFKSGLRRLKKLNGEIVVLLRRYQAAMAKKGGRRIGVSAHAQGNP